MRLWTTGDRVAALQTYDILDTPPEAAFEDIVEIARTLTGSPIALISLLDAERQWFKAARGADGITETPLDTSFCALAATGDLDVLVIPDATLDPRTAAMAIVTGEPRVRSYAGVLLRSSLGVPIGTVCVLDVVPREHLPSVVESLRALARQVTAQLELRRAVREGAEAAAVAREAGLGRELALQAARLGRWDHRPVTDARFFDARAREILGIGPDDDTSAADMLPKVHPDDRDMLTARLAEALKPDRIGPFRLEYRICDGGEVRWVSAVGRSLFKDEVCTRFLGVLEDVTERRVLEEQRAFLSAELNHRVKNILSLAQSVADSTLRAATDLPQARAAVGARLQALSRAHDILLAQQWRAAPLAEVAEAVLRALGAGSGPDSGRMELAGPRVELASRPALQLALALHELATNAAKYGALSNDTGRVALTWAVSGEGGQARLTVSWVERGGPPVTPPVRKGFGSRVIVRATQEAFGGPVELDYPPAGLRWSVSGPLAKLVAAEVVDPARGIVSGPA